MECEHPNVKYIQHLSSRVFKMKIIVFGIVSELRMIMGAPYHRHTHAVSPPLGLYSQKPQFLVRSSQLVGNVRGSHLDSRSTTYCTHDIVAGITL